MTLSKRFFSEIGRKGGAAAKGTIYAKQRASHAAKQRHAKEKLCGKLFVAFFRELSNHEDLVLEIERCLPADWEQVPYQRFLAYFRSAFLLNESVQTELWKRMTGSEM